MILRIMIIYIMKRSYDNYEINMVKYMKTLERDPKNIINKDIRKTTIKSIINHTAIFLNEICKNCKVVKLVDPIGIKIIKNDKFMRYAKCGNCGYSGYIKYYSQVIC